MDTTSQLSRVTLARTALLFVLLVAVLGYFQNKLLPLCTNKKGSSCASHRSLAKYHQARPPRNRGSFSLAPKRRQQAALWSNVRSSWQTASSWFLHMDVHLEKLYTAIRPRTPPYNVISYNLPVNAVPFPHSHRPFDMLGPVGPRCRQPLAKFGKGDDEKRFCASPSVLTSDSCVVISIGSADQWAFEEAIFHQTNCSVYTYDCTGAFTVPVEIRSRVHFEPICIGAADATLGGKRFLTWNSLLSYSEINTSPSLLKMDVEGFEYEVLRAMLGSTNDALLPVQIALELHYQSFATDTTWGFRGKTPGEIGAFMSFLFNKGGYMLADRHDNDDCPHCTEVLLVRAGCWVPDSGLACSD
eukprot:NODE_626_length_1256_cov_285.195526_g453_i0.p1 GENE.NODE_626_length_1256_cov_285.195526_g453_i0~~NODE_626_length_1256_cov_285.195526_g453_i0.p1  ORF type:complete len:357 (-),score=81.14 NODE_626_length_1256_cov_285.195526_g453_i0:122-1192(-)